MKDLEQLAWDEAEATALADLGGLTTDEIIAQLEEGDIPEEVAVWEPFEYYDAHALLGVIDGFQSQFVRFTKSMLEEASK